MDASFSDWHHDTSLRDTPRQANKDMHWWVDGAAASTGQAGSRGGTATTPASKSATCVNGTNIVAAV
jgi:hypothetical protein